MLHTCTRFQPTTVKLLTSLFLILASTWAHSQTLSTTYETGNHEGFHYWMWKSDGRASMTLESGGRYTSSWDQDTFNWIGGLGWQAADNKVFQYTGSFEPEGNAYLAVYGVFKNPEVDFYIIESWTTYDPSNCAFGKVTARYQADGANYEFYICEDWSLSFERRPPTYYSMRVPKKAPGAISGTIDLARHFDEWRKAGVNLGANDFTIMATEGYRSKGKSDITISEIKSASSSSSSSGTTSNPAIVGGATDYLGLVLTAVIAIGMRLKRRETIG